MDHSALMDRIYRYQRFFYDATRVFFLPGRDALISAVDARPGATLLEMGCGTARNLIKLAKRYPGTRLFGADISEAMLHTANKKIREAGLENRITVTKSAAEAVHYARTFGLEGPFDAVIFSYALTMMPTFEAAIRTARENVSDSGALYAVDFWDAGAWPRPMRSLLTRWLSLFHVRFDHSMHAEIHRRFPETEIRPVKGRYAFIAVPRTRG